MNKRALYLLALLAVLGALLIGCGAGTPQVVRETVVVQQTSAPVVQTQVVEKQVVQTQVVEKVVTPTAAGPTAVPVVNGFYGATADEAKTAQVAWDAADKGKPDPAWKGQKFTVAVYSAGQRGAISGPTYFWRPKFEELTGATYDIVEIPFADLSTKIFADYQTGAHQYDVITNCANWYGDAISNDWIVPLDKYFTDPRMPKWDQASLAPAVKNLYTWNGQWYGANNDHDAMILYYRKDVLSDPKWQAQFKQEKGHDMPVAMNTWDDVLEIAQFFNGRDWVGDGKLHDGITMHLKVGGQGFFHYMALAAPYVTLPNPGADPRKVDKYHNLFFFDPETMEPLINSPGHVAALDMLIKLSKAGPSAMWGWSLGEAWADFLTGNAVLTFSWGDVGALAEDPTQSKVMGKVGARGLPGTLHPYDLQTKQFLNLTQPNMVGNQVGCSWHPVLSKYAKNADLAYYWMALMATPSINHWNVEYGWTGLNPGTSYDWLQPKGKATIDEYKAAGWNADDATGYVNAYTDDFFNYPIFQGYLRIPGTPEMSTDWDQHLSEAITGQISSKEALDRTAADWKRIIDQNDKAKELKLYQQSIGFTPGQ